jgi:hypothetical protein
MTAEELGCGCCTTTAKRVENDIAWIRGKENGELRKSFWKPSRMWLNACFSSSPQVRRIGRGVSGDQQTVGDGAAMIGAEGFARHGRIPALVPRVRALRILEE